MDTLAPSEPVDTVDIYTWKTESPNRRWRFFLAGAILGAAVLKAAELVLHRDKKPAD